MEDNCPDCRVGFSEYHLDGCDVARCMICGGQAFSCGCEFWDVDSWTGFWPGELEAIGFGFYCYWGPDFGERGWKECSSEHPNARPDLNTLYAKTIWNPNTKQRELV